MSDVFHRWTKQGPRDRASLDVPTFERLLLTHGPDFTKWPADWSAQAQTLVSADARARGLLDEAWDLERSVFAATFASDHSPKFEAAVMRRVLAGRPRTASLTRERHARRRNAEPTVSWRWAALARSPLVWGAVSSAAACVCVIFGSWIGHQLSGQLLAADSLRIASGEITEFWSAL